MLRENLNICYMNIMMILMWFFSRDQCFEARCTACKAYFGKGGPAGYDCAGQCGLCALCSYNPGAKECELYCKEGVAACTETCNKGKAICLNCKKECGL